MTDTAPIVTDTVHRLTAAALDSDAHAAVDRMRARLDPTDPATRAVFELAITGTAANIFGHLLADLLDQPTGHPLPVVTYTGDDRIAGTVVHLLRGVLAGATGGELRQLLQPRTIWELPDVLETVLAFAPTAVEAFATHHPDHATQARHIARLALTGGRP